MNATAPIQEYRVGTLIYTRRTLARLFFLLLLGDFSMVFMAVALPKLLPLQLNSMGVDSGKMGWILSLGPLVSLFFSPFIGVWSDRLRTRWGRRRPFLIASTPVLAIGLLLIPHIKSYTLLCVVIFVVQIANVLETVLYYLYADIIPPELMGRFMGATKIVGTLGALSFQYFLMPNFDRSPIMVWTVCSLVYLAFYQLSLMLVKEGQYPIPEEIKGREMVRSYIKDGFCSRYIWILWCILGVSAIATPSALFTDLISKRIFHIDMTTIGHMNAYATGIGLLVMFPSGLLLDKFGPRLIWSVSCLAVGTNNLLAFFWVNNADQMQWYYILNAVLYAPMSVAMLPMLYAHLPKSKFGQLVSTQSMVVQSLIFISTNALGQLIASHGENYKIALLYAGPVLMLTPVFALFLNRVRNPFDGEEMSMRKLKAKSAVPCL